MSANTFTIHKYVEISLFEHNCRREFLSVRSDIALDHLGEAEFMVPAGCEYEPEKTEYSCGLYHNNEYCELHGTLEKPYIVTAKGRIYLQKA